MKRMLFSGGCGTIIVDVKKLLLLEGAGRSLLPEERHKQSMTRMGGNHLT